MRTENDVLRAFAKEIAERISRKTISALQKITDTLSGDDSELKNAWDEVCVQVQHDQSFFWDAYDNTVRSIVTAYIEELQSHEKLVLWFQTEQGWDWLYDHVEDSDEDLPVFDEDIVKYIVQEYVYYKANDWTNERIRAYLDRHYLD
jgi:hypothetical protein